MKVLFLYSYNPKAEEKMAISPFLMPQINSIIPFLDDYKIVGVAAGASPKTYLNNIARLREIKRHISSDWCVFSMYGSLSGYACTSVFAGENPFVISFGGSDLFGSRSPGLVARLKDSLVTRLSKRSARKANAVLVKSQELHDVLTESIQKKSEVIPNGIDLETFSEFSLNKRNEIRKELGWANDELVVLFNLRRKNAKGEYVKNFPLAEETIEKLKTKVDSRVRLELISGKNHSEINEMMNAANCLLLTSLHEGSPNIVKEAMAANLPVVSVNCGDVAHLLANVRNSHVFTNYNSNELGRAIQEYSDFRTRSNGRDRIQTLRLDKKSVSLRIINLFKYAKENFGARK